MKVKLLFVVLILLFLGHVMQAQNKYADSLKSVLAGKVPDTVRVNILIELCRQYISSDYTLASQYANDAKKEARKANFSIGLAKAYRYSGTAFYYHGKLREAMDDWQFALHIFDSIHNKSGMASILNNIGAVYFEQGDNTRALENYLRSLKLAQQIGNDLSTATAMVNIGAVYMDKKSTHKLALEYYQQALAISEKIKHTRTIGNVCSNIGLIYLDGNDDKLAEKYLKKALVNLKGSDLGPSVLLGLGRVEMFRKDYSKALSYQQEAYTSALEYDNLLYATQSLVAQAQVRGFTGNKELALNAYKKAIPLATEIGAYLELRSIYEGLAGIYSESSRYDSAYRYLELLGTIKDSLFNEAADKRLSVLRLDFELEKKESKITQLTTVNDLNEKIILRQRIIRNLITAGLISLLIFFYVVFRQKRKIEREKQRSEDLLLNILPGEIAEELKATGISDARHFSEVSVLFTDFVDFTTVSQQLPPQELVTELNIYFRAFDEIITRHGIEKIKTIGDAYMAAGGVPKEDEGSISNVVLAAIEMQEFVLNRQHIRQAEQAHFFKMRVGIHTGPVVAGIVGVKKFQYDIWGDTVNTASRMESNGMHGKVNISQSVYDRIKHLESFTFVQRDSVEVKGIGAMQMYFVWKK